MDHESLVLQILIGSWFLVSAVRLSLWDLTFHRLPNLIVVTTLFGSFIGFCLLALNENSGDQLLRASLGALISVSIYFVLYVGGGMGMGDVKYSAVTGLYLGWLGWEYLWWGTFIAFGLAGMLVIVRSRALNKSSVIPFGPFMALGVIGAALIAFVAAPTAIVAASFN